jgi:hypothetical protein
LKEKYPHLEFHHCYGPGVIAVGSAPPQPVAESAGSTACRRARVAQLHRTDRKASDVNAGDSFPDLRPRDRTRPRPIPSRAGAVPDDWRRAHPVIHGGKHRLAGNFPDIYSLVRAADPDGIGLRIDLGCGACKPPGVIGFDNLEGIATQVVNGANAPDVFIDLNCDPLPLRDGSCSEVRASHFLEHSALAATARPLWPWRGRSNGSPRRAARYRSSPPPGQRLQAAPASCPAGGFYRAAGRPPRPQRSALATATRPGG